MWAPLMSRKYSNDFFVLTALCDEPAVGQMALDTTLQPPATDQRPATSWSGGARAEEPDDAVFLLWCIGAMESLSIETQR